MINKLDLKRIAENENQRYVDSYLKGVIKNLETLLKEEGKYMTWSFLVVFFFLLFTQADISAVKLGFVEIKDLDIIPKVLPVIYIYIIFNLEVMKDHKIDLQKTVTFVANIMYKQQPSNNFLVHYTANTSIHALHPYNFDDQIAKLMHQKAKGLNNVFNYIFNFIVKIIGTLPYLFTIYMLYFLRTEYYDSLIGKIGFWLTILMTMALVIFLVKHALMDRFKIQKMQDEQQQEELNKEHS